MKNYIVYCKGEEIGIIQAGSHNAKEISSYRRQNSVLYEGKSHH